MESKPTPMETLLETERTILNDTYKGSRLLQAIKKGHILYKNNKIYLHTLDRDILNIYAHSIRHSFRETKEWLLLYPSEKFELFALFALEAMAITSYLKNQEVFCHENYNNRNRALLITDDKSVRSEYIFLNKKYENVGLHYTYLGLSIIGFDGNVKPLIYGNEKQYGGTMAPYFCISPSLDILPKENLAKKLAVAILDLRKDVSIDKIDEFRAWATQNHIPLLLYVTCSLVSKPMISLLENDIPVWGWNDDIIRNRIFNNLKDDLRKAERYPTPFISTLPNMINLAKGITNALILVNEPTINRYLIELRKEIYSFKKERKNDVLISKIIRQLYNTIISLEEMTAPFSYCEKYLGHYWGCQTISQRIISLESLLNRLSGKEPSTASYLKGVLVKLKELIEYMSKNRSGKPIIIEKIIEQAQKTKKTLAIVNRINALEYALQSYLEERNGISIKKLERQGIFFLNYSEFLKNPYYYTVLLYGLPHQNQLNFFGCSNCLTKGFLLYASEQKIFNWLQKQHDSRNNIFSYGYRVRNLSKITGIIEPKIRNHIKEIDSEKQRKRKEFISLGSQNADTGKLDLSEINKIFPIDEFSSLTDYLEFGKTLDIEEETLLGTRNAPVDLEKKDGLISCIILTLPGGKKIIIPTYRRVPIYDNVREKIDYKPVKKVSDHDTLILVNKSSAKGLADAVISRVDSHPKMVKTVANQQLWIEILKDEMTKNNHKIIDVSNLLEKYGCPRTPVAIYHWVNGQTIGPRDKRVIEALGKIYDNNLLKNKVDMIWAAVRRLRSMHQTIKLRLKYFATHYVTAQIEEDEVIDEELNLYLSDFKGVIDLVKIEGVEGPKDIDTYFIDRILSEDEYV